MKNQPILRIYLNQTATILADGSRCSFRVSMQDYISLNFL